MSDNSPQRDDLEKEIQDLKAHIEVLHHFIQRMGALGFYERNIRTGEVTINQFWSACGYKPEHLLGDAWLSLVHPEDLPRVLDVFGTQTASQGEESFEIEYRVRTAWGQWRWVLNRGIVVGRDEKGIPSQYLGIDMDITDRKLAEEELRLQQEAAEQRALESETLRMVGAVVASTLDPAEALQRILEQAALVVPYEFASVLRLNGNFLEPVGSLGGTGKTSRIKLGDQRMSKNGATPHSQVVREGQALIFNRAHELFPVRVIDGRAIKSWLGVPLMLRGALTGMITFESTAQGFFTDSHLRVASAFADSVAIALENARLYEELKRTAITDELTGLYTRRWIQEYARRQLERAQRNSGDMSLLMIDVDYFKRVNDEFGHMQGDQVLKLIANVCLASLRSGDVICRYGGEEFLALLPDTNSETALLVAERLRLNVLDTTVPGLKENLTVSIGISGLGDSRGATLSELIHHSDTALYSAKRKGRNCCVVSEGK